MAEEKKAMEMEEDEILRVSVRKKSPDANDYSYELSFISNDEDAARLAEVFEKALDKEIDFPFLIKVLEKAIEEGIDLSAITEDNI